jgi:hypothetical protein
MSQRPHRTAHLTAPDTVATFDDKGFAQRAAGKGWVPKVLVP